MSSDIRAPQHQEQATKPTRLRQEVTRAWVAVAISTPLSLVLSIAVQLWLSHRVGVLPLSLLGWVLWSLCYALLILRAFGRATAEQLPALVGARRVPLWKRLLAGGADGPGFAVQLAAVALAAAAILPRLERFAPADDEGILLTVLIIATVITCWSVVTLSYAVHYARRHVADGGGSADGLDFPGDDSPGFVDYLYFSTAVATTFGTTDVEVTSSRLRRVVTGHAVLTFVFNTVIIALMVSALTG